MTKTGKINYVEFKRLIFESIPKMLPKEYNGADVVQKRVFKVNQALDAFTLYKHADSERVTVSPVFYIEELFKMFQHGESMQKLISYITDALQSTIELKVGDSTELDFEQVKNRITIELINHEKNEYLLDSIVHSDFLDLACIYRIEIPVTANSRASVMITNEMLDAWQMEPKVLHRIAYQNMKHMHPTIISSILPTAEEEEILDSEPVIYVLTNTASMYGASALIFNGILQRISTDIFNGDFYILPSSLHEVLLIHPEPERIDELREIIKGANREVIEPELFLSDNLYYYDAELDEVKIA